MFARCDGAWEAPLLRVVYATYFGISVSKSEHLSQKKGLDSEGTVQDRESDENREEHLHCQQTVLLTP